MDEIKRVGILGLGAIGGLIASQIYDYDKGCVYVLAKEERINRYRNQPLQVNGKEYEFQYSSPDNTEKMDLIIVSVKYHNLTDAIELIKNYIHEDTIIISLMNGINTENEIGKIYGMERMLYSFIVEVSAVKEGGIINANKGKIVFNSNPSGNKNSILVQEFFEKAGIVYEINNDIMKEVWWKFMINVGINQTSAILDSTYGICQKNKHIKNIMDAAMNEVILISQYENVNLSETHLKRWYKVLEDLNPDGMTSMLQDMRTKRKTEVDMFAGVICSLGNKHNIPTPVNEMLYEMIKAKEEMFEK